MSAAGFRSGEPFGDAVSGATLKGRSERWLQAARVYIGRRSRCFREPIGMSAPTALRSVRPGGVGLAGQSLGPDAGRVAPRAAAPCSRAGSIQAVSPASRR